MTSDDRSFPEADRLPGLPAAIPTEELITSAAIAHVDDVVFQLAYRLIAHACHEVDLVIDENERGIFRL